MADFLPKPVVLPRREGAQGPRQEAPTGPSLEERQRVIYESMKVLSAEGQGFVVEYSEPGASQAEKALRNDFLLVEFKYQGKRIVADVGLKDAADRLRGERFGPDNVRVMSETKEIVDLSLVDFARMQRLYTENPGNQALSDLARMSQDPAQLSDSAANVALAGHIEAVKASGVAFYIEDADGRPQYDWRLGEASEGGVRIQRQEGDTLQEAELDPVSFALLQGKWLNSPGMKALWAVAEMGKAMRIGLRPRQPAGEAAPPAAEAHIDAPSDETVAVPGLLQARIDEHQSRRALGVGKKR
jgi:hypothetical protein